MRREDQCPYGVPVELSKRASLNAAGCPKHAVITSPQAAGVMYRNSRLPGHLKQILILACLCAGCVPAAGPTAAEPGMLGGMPCL